MWQCAVWNTWGPLAETAKEVIDRLINAFLLTGIFKDIWLERQHLGPVQPLGHPSLLRLLPADRLPLVNQPQILGPRGLCGDVPWIHSQVLLNEAE